MSIEKDKEICEKILALADIKINGNRKWDIKVHNEKVYSRILSQGSLGLGESYVEGWWDCEQLDEFFNRLLSANLDKKAVKYLSFKSKTKIASKYLLFKLFNMQSYSKSKEVADIHYNLGNDFYKHMLDHEFMQYTCAYWKDAKNLDQAQENKLNLICRKLHLSTKDKKDKIIELGSGFGGFSKYAAKNFNCSVLSYNISKEQIAFAREINKSLNVEIKEEDYRNALNPANKGAFDKAVSIGMMEHVGPKNYKNFMKLANYCLKDKNLLLIHTISKKITGKGPGDPWISKYIFPGGHLPSASQITKAAEGYFQLEDIQNFGQDYDKTLMAWYKNFDKNWPKFKDKYGERFYRMWRYYLLSCAGGFRSGSICLYQFVFSKGNYEKVYEAER